MAVVPHARRAEGRRVSARSGSGEPALSSAAGKATFQKRKQNKASSRHTKAERLAGLPYGQRESDGRVGPGLHEGRDATRSDHVTMWVTARLFVLKTRACLK